MPRPRFERLDSEKREHILEVAAREFVSHGYRGASLNHIIESLGLSKGSFYYYFDDKADLFATVVQSAWEALLQGWTPDVTTLDRDSFWRYLETFARDARARLRAACSLRSSRQFEPFQISWNGTIPRSPSRYGSPSAPIRWSQNPTRPS